MLVKFNRFGTAIVVVLLELNPATLAHSADTNIGASEAEIPPPDSELDEIELKTVTVNAKANKPTVRELPGTSSTIGSETIEKQLVRNIKDLIRYEPGVNVGNDPQRFGASGFTIRGLGGNRVLMQIDGVRMPDAFSVGSFASATRNAIDMDALKSVEIVRGSGSAAYGGDALGGTVSFVTKDPRDYLNIFNKNYYTGLKLGYNTTDNSFMQTATLAGAFRGWESMLLFTHSKSEESDNKGDNKSADGSRTAPSPQDNQNVNLLGKMLYRFNDDNVLRLTGEWLQSQSDLDALHARGRDFSFRFVNTLISDDSQSRWRLSLDQTLKNIDLPVFDSLIWKIYTQQSATRQLTSQDRFSNAEKRTLIKRIFEYENDDIGGELQLNKTFKLGFSDHVAQYGGQITQNAITQQRDGNITYIDGNFGHPKDSISNFVNPDTFPVRDFPLSTITKAGIYAQDTIAIWNKQIELVPGGRWEYYRLLPKSDYLFEKANEAGDSINAAEIEASEFLPKFGALLRLSDIFTVHGQYTHGFRGPNFSDANTGFTNISAGYSSIPNPALQPETSTGAEIGLRGKGNAGNFDVTLFRNDYDNFIFDTVICNPTTSKNCPLGFLTYQTLNSPAPIRFQGIELKSRLYLDWLTPSLQGASMLVSGSYTEGLNLETQSSHDDAVRAISPMKGVIGLRYDRPSGDWGTEIIMTLVGSKQANTAPVDAPYLTDGYGVIDFNGYYNVDKHVTFNAGIFNVLDKKYIDWEDVNTRASDPHATLGPFANADIWDRYSRPGRNLGITVKIAY